MRALLIFLAGTLPILTAYNNAYAELYSCKGVWTNQPCDGEVETVLEERPVRVPSEEQRVLSEIESLLHSLRMKSIDARHDYGVELSIDHVVSRCYSLESLPNQRLADCREAVNTKEEQLRERIYQEELLKIRRAELERKDSEPAREVVTVIDRERYIYLPRRHRKPGSGKPGSGVHRQPPGTGVNQKPGRRDPEAQKKPASRFDIRMQERKSLFDRRREQRQGQ